MDLTTFRPGTRVRPNPPTLFDEAFADVAGDAVCAPHAARIRAHAVEVACLARELSAMVGADPGDAFTAGLLHDIGQLLLLHRDPSGYAAMIAAGMPHDELLCAEKLEYGTDHALLGAEHLLEHRVVHAVADAVADHHDPFADSAPTTLVVAAADELLEADPGRRPTVDRLRLGGSRPGPTDS